MNKKGFTLVELLAVIVIMAIIFLIAAPNIIKIIDRGKKETFITDATHLISKAKYKYSLDKYQSLFSNDNSSAGCNGKKILAKNLDFNKEEDPDGNTYDLENSAVIICDNGNSYVNIVTIPVSENEARGTDGFVYEGELDNSKIVCIENCD